MSISTALPCRIAVYEEAGKVTLATLLPTQVLGLLTSADLTSVARDVEAAIIAMMDEAAQV
jgi:uncharacterized protein (DUF302 family)